MANRGVLAVALLVALIATFYWKLTLTSEFVWFDHSDMVYLELPRLEFQARELHKGRFPLWDPHIWMGQPLIGQTQPGPVNPLNLLMMLWPLDEAGYLRTGVLNLYFVAMHLVAALGFYWLCRELKRSRAASILAAGAFSLGGFVGSAPWLDVLSGALWTPWVALFFVRAVRGRRPVESAAVGGLFLGVAWLSGHHEIPLLVTIALGCCWLAAMALQPAQCRVALMGRAALMLAIAGLVGALQMWPTLEFGRLAMRWGPAGPGPVGWQDKIPYLSSSIYSFTPRGIFGIAFPDQGTTADSSAFLGVIVSSLALRGLVMAWRHAAVRWLAVLAGASLIYAMGEFTPVHGALYTLLPMLEKARVPVRALHLFNFSAALLAAYGLDQLLSGRAARWSRRIAAAFALAGGCILLGALGWNAPASEALLLSAFVSLGWFALVAAWAHRRVVNRALGLGLALLLMMAELNTVLTRGWRSRFEEKAQPHARMLAAHRDVVEFLRREPAPNRVRVNDHDIPVNFGDLHSIDMHEGYSAGVTANLLHFGRHTPAAQRLFAVTHYVGRQAELPDWEEVFAGAEGIKVFRNPHPLARARSVHQVEAVRTASLLTGRIEDPAFDAGTTALLVGSEAPILQQCEGGDQVKIAAYAPNRVRIQTAMRCRGMVVLADTWFPGWEASIEGRPARIWEVYGGLRGVVVDAGRHEVDFKYRPTSVYGGAALSAAGLLTTLVLIAVPRARARACPLALSRRH